MEPVVRALASETWSKMGGALSCLGGERQDSVETGNADQGEKIASASKKADRSRWIC